MGSRAQLDGLGGAPYESQHGVLSTRCPPGHAAFNNAAATWRWKTAAALVRCETDHSVRCGGGHSCGRPRARLVGGFHPPMGDAAGRWGPRAIHALARRSSHPATTLVPGVNCTDRICTTRLLPSRWPTGVPRVVLARGSSTWPVQIILPPNSFTQCVEPKPRGGWAFAAPGQLRERRGALTDSRPGRRIRIQLYSPSLISSPRRCDHLRALQPLYLLFCQLATSPQPSLQRPSHESFSPQMAGRP